jgi:hypothetical protein
LGCLDLASELFGWEKSPGAAGVFLVFCLMILAATSFLVPVLAAGDTRGLASLWRSTRAFARAWFALGAGLVTAFVLAGVGHLFASRMLRHQSLLHALGHNHALTDTILILLVPVRLLPWIWLAAIAPILVVVLYRRMIEDGKLPKLQPIS